MSGADEQALLEKWKSGDSDAFGDLFEIHASRLYNVAYRLTGREEEAKDLVQNALLKAFSSSSHCQSGAHFYGWLRKVLTNLFFDGQKFKKRAGRDLVVEVADWEEAEARSIRTNEGCTPRKALERKERLEEVEGAILELPSKYRTLVALREIERLSYAEIADELGVPVETVRTGLRRAREMLRRGLKGLLE